MTSDFDRLRTDTLQVLESSVKAENEPDPTGASEDALLSLEATLGFPPPILLMEWLRTCNGSYVGAGCLFGVVPSDSFIDISSRLRLYPEWTQLGFIPVAGDGCGNTYVIAAGGQFGLAEPVLFMDGYYSETEPCYTVASNVWHFVKFYLLRDMDMTEWPFDEAEVVAADPDILKVVGARLPWKT